MIKYIYEMTNEEIQEYINNHLSIRKKEKDKYGEVFTHPDLINKILDLFPNNVYKNPHLKWLDPSVGIGHFMILLYVRLMDGLESWEPNKKKRSDHIIHNMLYMVEINNTNCKKCNAIFGKNANIYCSNFLSDITFTSKNGDNILFDCIIGNPPFQDNFGLSDSGKRINGGKSKLYERIFLKAYRMLNSHGYISFVVPDNLFSGNGSESYKTLVNNYVSFVSFNPFNQDFFPGIQQTICYFIMQQGYSSLKTTIEGFGGKTFQVVLEDRPVNPIHEWTIQTESLIRKYVSNERNNAIYNRGYNLSSYNGNKYPIIYSASKNIATNNLKLAVGMGIKKAVIFSISTKLQFKMDYTGNYGVGPNTFYIPFTTNIQGKLLERFLDSSDYKTMALATKSTRQFLKIAFIEHLKLTKIMNIMSDNTKTNKTKKINTRINKNSKKNKSKKNKSKKNNDR
jgi:hypothetical protein